jgi:hypothetical protein
MIKIQTVKFSRITRCHKQNQILLFLFYYLANKLDFSFQFRKELFENSTVMDVKINSMEVELSKII